MTRVWHIAAWMVLVIIGLLCVGRVYADTPAVVEKAPQVTLERITLEGSGITHEILPGRSKIGGPFNFPTTLSSASITFNAWVRVKDVEDFRLSVSLGRARRELAPLSTEGDLLRFWANWTIPVGRVQRLQLFGDFKPLVEPIRGSSVLTEDGKLDLGLSAGIGADENLRAGSGCEGAVHSYFVGRRAIGALVDMAQFGAVVVVDVSLDILSVYIGGKWAREAAEGATRAGWRFIAQEVGKRFLVSAANSLTQSVLNSFIKGTPWLKYWDRNVMSAFVSGVMGGAFQARVGKSYEQWLGWLNGGAVGPELRAAAALAAKETMRVGTAGGNAALGQLGTVWERMTVEYRQIADRLGISPRYFVLIRDETVIRDHKVQVAGLQWLVTGEGSLLVSCTPPGQSRPAANYLVRFRMTGGRVSNIQVSPQRVARDVSHDAGEMAKAQQADPAALAEQLSLKDVAEAREETESPDPAAKADAEGWRPVFASPVVPFVVRNNIAAAEVPAGAEWRIERLRIDRMDAFGAVSRTSRHEGEFLAGRPFEAAFKVTAAIGGAWIPVSGATVAVAWDGGGAPANVTTGEDGTFVLQARVAAAPKRHRLELAIANTAAKRGLDLQSYDYGVEDVTATPASKTAAADGEDGVTLQGRIVRRFRDTAGQIVGRGLIEPTRDFNAVRFVGLNDLELTVGDGAASSDAVDFTPSSDGRFSLKVTSKKAGRFDIRVIPIGGLYRTADATFHSVGLRFTGGPADFKLAFGPDMAAQVGADGIARYDGIALNTSEEIPLSLFAYSTREGAETEGVEGVELSLDADLEAAIQIRYGRVKTGESGEALGGPDRTTRPSLWRLEQVGPVTITVTAPEAANELKIVLTGIDPGKPFQLTATADPRDVDYEADPWSTVSGTLKIPAGEDMGSVLESRYKLWASVKGGAGLDVGEAARIGEIRERGGERVVQLKPTPANAPEDAPATGRFAFEVSVPLSGPAKVTLYVTDSREGETVEQIELEIPHRPKDPRVSLRGSNDVEACRSVEVALDLPDDFPADGWLALVAADAGAAVAVEAVERDQQALGPLGETAELYAPSQAGGYEVRLYEAKPGVEVAAKVALTVREAETPAAWRASSEPGIDACHAPLLGWWTLEQETIAGPALDINPPRWFEITLEPDEAFLYRMTMKPEVIYANLGKPAVQLCNREGNRLDCLARIEEAPNCPPVDLDSKTFHLTPDGEVMTMTYVANQAFDAESCSARDTTAAMAAGGHEVPTFRLTLRRSPHEDMTCSEPIDPFLGETFDPERETFAAYHRRVMSKVGCQPVQP